MLELVMCMLHAQDFVSRACIIFYLVVRTVKAGSQ